LLAEENLKKNAKLPEGFSLWSLSFPQKNLDDLIFSPILKALTTNHH
jgi:hypothetical protein